MWQLVYYPSSCGAHKLQQKESHLTGDITLKRLLHSELINFTDSSNQIFIVPADYCFYL